MTKAPSADADRIALFSNKAAVAQQPITPIADRRKQQLFRPQGSDGLYICLLFHYDLHERKLGEKEDGAATHNVFLFVIFFASAAP